MAEESNFDAAMKLLTDPAFKSAAVEAVRDYMSWGELANHPVPEGLTREQLWQALAAVRRIGATTFPLRIATGDEFWYTITIEGRRCLRMIERHCRSDARLNQMIQHRTGRRFLVSAQIQETIASCKNDGVEADTAELEAVLQEGRAPRTPEGRLVKNAYEMLDELPSLIDEDFSPELAVHFFERATHGVDLSGLKRSDSRLRAVPSVFRQLVSDHLPRGTLLADMRDDETSSRALSQICDYANGKTGDPREPVAIKGYLLLASMGYWHPLPDFNAIVARHMFRLLSAKRDFPVMGYLPTSLMLRRWSDGRLAPGSVRYTKIEPGIDTKSGLDGTAEILVHLQLTVAAIDDLLALIHSTKEEDEALNRALETADRLNYRQRDVITRALRRPGTEFTLREHRLTYRTVYSTARADLLELAEMGYLVKLSRGQAFVFTAAEDLRTRLGDAEGATD